MWPPDHSLHRRLSSFDFCDFYTTLSDHAYMNFLHKLALVFGLWVWVRLMSALWVWFAAAVLLKHRRHRLAAHSSSLCPSLISRCFVDTCFLEMNEKLGKHLCCFKSTFRAASCVPELSAGPHASHLLDLRFLRVHGAALLSSASHAMMQGRRQKLRATAVPF